MMTRAIMLGAALLFAAGTAAAPALADDAARKPAASDSATGTTIPKTEPTPNTGGLAPDTETTASTGGNVAAADLLAAIKDSRNSANAIGSMKAVSRVRIVKIDDVAKGGNAGTVKSAIEGNKQDITGLQAAVESNPALSEKLKASQTDMSSIVAAKVEGDGSVTLYVE
jgi:hypothetical protein